MTWCWKCGTANSKPSCSRPEIGNLKRTLAAIVRVVCLERLVCVQERALPGFDSKICGHRMETLMMTRRTFDMKWKRVLNIQTLRNTNPIARDNTRCLVRYAHNQATGTGWRDLRQGANSEDFLGLTVHGRRRFPQVVHCSASIGEKYDRSPTTNGLTNEGVILVIFTYKSGNVR